MYLLLVGVLECQVAAEDLQEDAAELLRRDVVQQGVHHRAQVEEGVSDGKKSDVRSEVGDRPVLLRLNSSHDPSDLVWHPAYCQGCNNQSWHTKRRASRPGKERRAIRSPEQRLASSPINRQLR
uniref:Secreted protein n=1 Tax=Dromaius novaehollandiae TaxID=8790 RepID=A0A8C4P8U4_DRONO